MMQTIQAPMTTMSYGQPMMQTMAAPRTVTEIDQVNAFGQVVERDFVVRGAGGAVTEIDKCNAFGQVVERDFVVGGARAVSGGIGAPVTTCLNGVARVLGV